MIGRFRFPVTSGGHLIQSLLKARLNSKSDWIASCCCSNEFWKLPVTPVGTCFSVKCSHGDFTTQKKHFTISHLCPLTVILLPGTSKKSLDLPFFLPATTYSLSTFCIFFQFIVVEMAVHEQSILCTHNCIEILCNRIEILLHLCTQNKTFGCHINNNKGVIFLEKGYT